MEKQTQTPQLPQNVVTSSVLTLEHLSMAMIYNYSLQYFDDERELLHNDCKIVELREDEMTIANGEYQYDVNFDDIKLIVRPLIDLEKEIDFNGSKFSPMKELQWLYEEWFEVDKYIVNGLLDFRRTKNLLKWNFDIYNLIKNELAISIHDVG